MKTDIIKVDISKPGWDKQLDHAAQVLKGGGLVAFPTETVYGLGANALDQKAVEGIYTAKGRPADNPLIVHIAETNIISELTSKIPDTAAKLIEACWPGPLTLLMPKSGRIPGIVTAGLDTVGLRMPSNPIALELIRRSGVPVAAPSANSSGRPSPTLAKHVIEDLSGKVDVIIDGGSTTVGLESTVLDITVDPPMILRPGGITYERLARILGAVRLDPAISPDGKLSSPPRAPGMKYRHYAPKAMMLLIQGEPEPVADEIGRRAELYNHDGTNVGILVTDETAALYEPVLHAYCKFISLGSRQNPETLAANLFKCLREFDENNVGVIMAEAPETAGIGQAVMNRMLKAAGGNIIKV
ncbi:MAG TPA: L-threonylcarbamoyladenylate synthase [Clostridia bacterium]|nr:L-threonylcarbamoyladenylate synthase [Clostridia bacterium]